MGRLKNSVVSVLLIVFLLYILSGASSMGVPSMFILADVVMIILLVTYLLIAWTRH